MHLRQSSIIAISLSVLLALPVTSSRAAKEPPQHRALEGMDQPPLTGPAQAGRSLCQTGITGAPFYYVGYVVPPDDSYYTLIDPSDCECPEPSSVQFSAAHIVAHFEYAYTVPVRVGIVQADLTDPECPVPMPGEYFCPPTLLDLEGPGYGVHDVRLPFSAPCTVSEKAFVEITFTEWVPDVPVLALTESCESCRSYNYYPGNNYDLCTFGFEGNPIMYAEATCPGAADAADRTPSTVTLTAGPNPFSASILVQLTLPNGVAARLEVFDAAGRRLRVLALDAMGPGTHAYMWDARGGGGDLVPPGIYFARVNAGDQVWTRTLVHVR